MGQLLTFSRFVEAEMKPERVKTVRPRVGRRTSSKASLKMRTSSKISLKMKQSSAGASLKINNRVQKLTRFVRHDFHFLNPRCFFVTKSILSKCYFDQCYLILIYSRSDYFHQHFTRNTNH